MPRGPDRRVLVPWLMQVVLAARAYGVSPIDAVSNDFRDLAAFEAECAEGRAMGFDGKMLIHPAQIDLPIAVLVRLMKRLRRRAGSWPPLKRLSHGAGAINIDGEMVERLHLQEAQKLLALVSS